MNNIKMPPKTSNILIVIGIVLIAIGVLVFIYKNVPHVPQKGDRVVVLGAADHDSNSHPVIMLYNMIRPYTEEELAYLSVTDQRAIVNAQKLMPTIGAHLINSQFALSVDSIKKYHNRVVGVFTGEAVSGKPNGIEEDFIGIEPDQKLLIVTSPSTERLPIGFKIDSGTFYVSLSNVSLY